MDTHSFHGPTLLSLLLILALAYLTGFELGEAATGSVLVAIGSAMVLPFLVLLAVALVSARRSGPPVSGS